MLAVHCGSESGKPMYESSGNTMLVVMRTDSLVSAKGFRAEYSRACGARIIVKDQGFLRSSETLHLNEDKNCTWILIAENPSTLIIEN